MCHYQIIRKLQFNNFNKCFYLYCSSILALVMHCGSHNLLSVPEGLPDFRKAWAELWQPQAICPTFSLALTQADRAIVTMCFLFGPLTTSLLSLSFSLSPSQCRDIPCWLSHNDRARATCAAYLLNCSEMNLFTPSIHPPLYFFLKLSILFHFTPIYI